MSDLETLFLSASRLLGDGQLDAAEVLLQDILRAAPDLAEAWANLALLHDRQGRAELAEAGYRRALALAPGLLQARLNFGLLLAAQKRFAEAEACYLRALQDAPRAPEAWSQLGVLYACHKREAEAEQCYRSALAIAPGHGAATFNLAYVLLRQGRYEEGWACMEARDWYAALDRELGLPRWQGESLADKAILIGLEAGHGDMIQFCRYTAQLKAAGARRVSVLCHPPLARLLRSLPGVDDSIALGDGVADPYWDFWTPPLSLPYRFATRLDTIPAELPYLAADPAAVAAWAARLGAGEGRRVGLVWKGNPRFENDRERSLPSLHTLAPLAAIPGLRFFSLQKGAGEDEAAAPPFPLTDLAADIGDFADTAAIVANLDLVIAVDTAVAHLAGALGKPCWILLPEYKTDWRWLDGRDDTPWYPGVVRLFRQPAGGGWSPVIAAVAAALGEFAGA
jgi:Flp pilus assembly protein TadD